MTKSTKNKGGRPRNAVNDELADGMGISTRRLRQLISAYGLDNIDDAKQLQMLAAKALIATRSYRAERERRALELENRTLLPHAEVIAAGERLAAIINTMTSEALANWPGELAGKSERGVRESLTRIFSQLRDDIEDAIKSV
jgi:hypothetical protein